MRRSWRAAAGPVLGQISAHSRARGRVATRFPGAASSFRQRHAGLERRRGVLAAHGGLPTRARHAAPVFASSPVSSVVSTKSRNIFQSSATGEISARDSGSPRAHRGRSMSCCSRHPPWRTYQHATSKKYRSFPDAPPRSTLRPSCRHPVDTRVHPLQQLCRSSRLALTPASPARAVDLFLNRRGYAPARLPRAVGPRAEPCSAHMVLHLSERSCAPPRASKASARLSRMSASVSAVVRPGHRGQLSSRKIPQARITAPGQRRGARRDGLEAPCSVPDQRW